MAENSSISKVKEKIVAADNILVALSKNPSVDEMSAAIGLTMILDAAGKHATAIYSGETPNALEFLKPEETFEANTNSLQDFIIALNKEKADHLRYKVEGDYVRVYITPYKTTIDESDLEFSHGDFNVDLVVALNVKAPEELDAALSEYGRIMHDASAINITAGEPGEFAELEWNDEKASSVGEMVFALVREMKEINEKMTAEIATAFLTGIVAATERFSNEKTTPETMSVASELMKAGADQKLIADNIELSGVEKHDAVDKETLVDDAENKAPKQEDDGEMNVEHEKPTEDPAMEQLRQVANDVKLTEFKPGQNPAEVVAPVAPEPEANSIPPMNFGMVIDPVTPEVTTPAELEVTAPKEVAVEEAKPEPVAVEPVLPMPEQEIELPPPPTPPIDMAGENAPELPQIEMKDDPTLPEEPTAAAEPTSAADAMMGNAESAADAMMGGESTEPTSAADAMFDPGSFQIPGQQ